LRQRRAAGRRESARPPCLRAPAGSGHSSRKGALFPHSSAAQAAAAGRRMAPGMAVAVAAPLRTACPKIRDCTGTRPLGVAGDARLNTSPLHRKRYLVDGNIYSATAGRLPFRHGHAVDAAAHCPTALSIRVLNKAPEPFRKSLHASRTGSSTVAQSSGQLDGMPIVQSVPAPSQHASLSGAIIAVNSSRFAHWPSAGRTKHRILAATIVAWR
jgi:hypothetical protein